MPVLKGMCKYESLLDGTVSLGDIALMNDMILCAHDNECLAHELAEEKRGSE